MQASKKPDIKLRLAIIATILALFIFIFLFIYIGIENRKNAYEDSKLLTKEISRKAALETEIFLSSALMTARSLEQKSKIIRRFGGRRHEIINLLYEAVKSNPNILSAWTLWEPDAFDGADSLYKNDSLHNELGMFGVGFFRDGHQIKTEISNPEDYQEDYYTIPRSLKSEVILEPYLYSYHQDTKVYYETSVIVPIIDDSTFLGVMGIDVDLTILHKGLQKTKLFKTGFLTLISNQGQIVSHPDSMQIQKNFYTKTANEEQRLKTAIETGYEFDEETLSNVTGKKVFRFFYPIKLRKAANPWSMMLEIPVNEAAIRSKHALYVAFVTLILGISIIVYLIFNIRDRIKYEKFILDTLAKVQESNKLISEKESNYREIFNSTNEAIFIHDPYTGKIVDINDVMLSMFGYDNKEEVLSLSIGDLSQEGGYYNTKEAKEYIKKAITEGPQIFEWISKTREGYTFWTEVSLRKALINGSDRILAVIRDISERKSMQKSLIESEEKYRHLIETSKDGICLVNYEGLIFYANRRKAEMFNQTRPEDMSGKSIFSLLAEEYSQKLQAIFPSLLEKGYIDNFYADANRSDGTIFPSEINLSVIKGIDGSQPEVMVTMRDISKRRKAEIAVRESQEKYQLLMESLNEVIMMVDNADKVLFVNKVFTEKLGYSMEEIVGKTGYEVLLSKEDQKIIIEANKERLQKKQGQYEARFIAKNRKQIDFLISGAPVYNNDGEIIGSIGAMTDITDRKAIEKELEKYRNHLEVVVKERTDELAATNEELIMSNEELMAQHEELESTLENLRHAQDRLIQTEKMASLGVLAAGVAHEINNPLNFISGGVTALETYITENLNRHYPEVAGLFEGIHTGVNRAAAIVTSLSHYSRRDDLPMVKCNIHQVINNCFVMIHNQIKNRIEVEKQFCLTECSILGNEGKLHQAFLNIIANAAQAIQDKGKITVQTIAGETNFKILISDNGCGIPKEILPKIMDPFFTTKAPGKGTGLGLSITYNIIIEHRGSIQFSSVFGKGTQVEIILPMS